MQESKNVDDLLYSPRNFGAVWETTMLMRWDAQVVDRYAQEI